MCNNKIFINSIDFLLVLPKFNAVLLVALIESILEKMRHIEFFEVLRTYVSSILLFCFSLSLSRSTRKLINNSLTIGLPAR